MGPCDRDRDHEVVLAAASFTYLGILFGTDEEMFELISSFPRFMLDVLSDDEGGLAGEDDDDDCC